jgi:hypothetical protein
METDRKYFDVYLEDVVDYKERTRKEQQVTDIFRGVE